MQEHAALLGLIQVDGLGSFRIHKLLRHFGSSQAILGDRKSTRLNSSHEWISRMPSSA